MSPLEGETIAAGLRQLAGWRRASAVAVAALAMDAVRARGSGRTVPVGPAAGGRGGY